MPRLLALVFLVAALIFGGFGISRLNYNVNILNLLPANLPGSEGTALFQSLFDRPDQLILTLHDPAGNDLADASADLAETLRGTPGLARRVQHEPPWMTDPAALVTLASHALLNAPPADLAALANSLDAANLDHTLKTSVGTLTGSLDPMESTLAARDPLGLGKFLAGALKANNSRQSSDGFSSASGDFHLLKIDAPRDVSGYLDASAWLADVQAATRAWQATRPADDAPLTTGFTGTPAFAAEIGSGMHNDMRQSVSGITLIVGILFFLYHRRIVPLFLILAAMLTSGLITLGIAGLVYGSLNVMSMGFAAILMGMIEDFGVVGLHEAMHRPGAGFRDIHKRVFPSIAWSALASAMVFASLSLSTLPGIAQMGQLTAIGILTGAVVMVYGFLPLAMRWTKPRPPKTPVAAPDGPALLSRWPAVPAVGLGVACAGILAVRGLPPVLDGPGLLRPKNCQAYESLMALEQILQPDKASEISLPVIIQAADANNLSVPLRALDAKLSHARASGLISGYFSPLAFTPDKTNQAANLPVLAKLESSRDRLRAGLDAAGFNAEGFRFADAVLDELAAVTRNSPGLPVWVDTARLTDLVGPLLHRDGTGAVACVFVRLPNTPRVFSHPMLDDLQSIHGVHVAGWDYLSAQIKSLLGGEVRRVLLPSCAILAVLIFLVFKSARERLLAAATLAFSGLVLLGMMSLLAIPWNFVNIGAVPLCLGLGLDFIIHMIHSLRQTDDAGPNIGRALAYCGLSTGLGFGALALAGNVGLASFGLTAMIGVLATLFSAAFLLPWAWRALKINHARP